MEGKELKIRQFLLGNATPADDEEISRRILSGDELDERISFAEETLIEDYLDERLTAEETRLFKENFLTSPARKELFEEISQLKDYARNNFAAVSKAAAKQNKTEGFWAGLFSLNYLRPVAAVVLILVAGILLWRVLSPGDGLSETEKTYAVLNGKDLSSTAVTGDIQSKSLIYGTFRSADDPAKLKVADLKGDVLFRLALPPGTSASKVFNFELVRGGQTVFRQTGLRVYQNPNGQELKVVVPKSVLPVGSYQISLDDEVSYAFRVE
jgi:hypothetical protein